jgi:hypothetical protein
MVSILGVKVCHLHLSLLSPSLQNVAECWALLKTMVDIPTLPQKAYEYRNTAAMQKAFVTQARHHLESRYKN